MHTHTPIAIIQMLPGVVVIIVYFIVIVVLDTLLLVAIVVLAILPLVVIVVLDTLLLVIVVLDTLPLPFITNKNLNNRQCHEMGLLMRLIAHTQVHNSDVNSTQSISSEL